MRPRLRIHRSYSELSLKNADEKQSQSKSKSEPTTPEADKESSAVIAKTLSRNLEHKESPKKSFSLRSVAPDKQDQTREHIERETDELLSFVPEKDKPFSFTYDDIKEIKADGKPQMVVLHYSNNLFKTMELMIGERNSKLFDLSVSGYDTKRIVHYKKVPNTPVDKLKGATVIIPICYGIPNPLTGDQVAKTAKHYLHTHKVKEVVVYMPRFSDPQLAHLSSDALQEIGKEKREDWIAKNGSALKPEKNNPSDVLNRVRIMERTGWEKTAAYRKAQRIFRFYQEINNSPIEALIKEDMKNYFENMKKKSEQKPIVSTENAKDSVNPAEKRIKVPVELFSNFFQPAPLSEKVDMEQIIKDGERRGQMAARFFAALNKGFTEGLQNSGMKNNYTLEMGS